MAVKQVLQARMEKHIKEMVTTNPMIGQLNTQFTSWLLGSGLTGTEIIQMIDSNMDAVIQPTELSDALQRTTGTKPPGWVINGLMSVLDMDKDGTVTVADLHTYFETIGLPSGIEEPEPEPEPDEFEELDKEIEEEARRQAEEIIRQQEAEKQRLLEEQQAKEAAEREAEQKAREEEEAAKAKPEPILLEEDGSPVGHARFIELLQDMKLSSERREAISQSPKQSCQILVSSVEKTLMGQGPMKNGMTVIGTLSENRDIEVELQLPSEANEQVQALQSNNSVEVIAQIVNWNVGRKRAVFTATDFDYS
jgi:hypothetical protein